MIGVHEVLQRLPYPEPLHGAQSAAIWRDLASVNSLSVTGLHLSRLLQ